MIFSQQAARTMIACFVVCLTLFSSKGMEVDPNTKVTLQGCDSEITYTIPYSAAEHSRTIEELVGSCGADSIIPLANISNDMLATYIVPALNAIDEYSFDTLEEEVLVNLSPMDLIEVMNAAHYLDIPELENAIIRIFDQNFLSDDRLSESVMAVLENINPTLQIKIASEMISWHASKILQRRCDHRVPHASVCFSPDGNILAASSGATITLWDVKIGTCTKTLNTNNTLVRSVCFSPDGKTLALALDDDTIKLWDIEAGEYTNVLRGHRNAIVSVCFSPKGRILASASVDSTIKLWHAESGECINTLKEDNDPCLSLCFHSSGDYLLSSSHHGMIRLWHVASCKCVNRTFFQNALITYSRFNIIAASRSKGSIGIWRQPTLNCVISKFNGCHDAAISSIHGSSDGKMLASGSSDCTIKLWDVDTRRCTQTLCGHNDRVLAVCFSPVDTILASESDHGEIRLWSPRYAIHFLKPSAYVTYIEQAWLIRQIMEHRQEKKYLIDFAKRSGEIFNSLSADAKKLIHNLCDFYDTFYDENINDGNDRTWTSECSIL